MQRQIFFSPAPWGPGMGSKGQILFNFNYKVKLIFIQNFVCVLTNEGYKTNQMGFSFCRLGNALGVGLEGTKGSKIEFRLAVCPACYLLLIHWTKFNQIWCVSYSHAWDVQRQKMGPIPSGGVKSQISFNFNYKDFYTKLCVCSHK